MESIIGSTLKKSGLEIFLSDLDTGPKETDMEKLRKRASPRNIEGNNFVDTWLPFAQNPKYQDKFLQLTLLIQKLKELPPSFTTSSIVTWIHYTNKIENEGMKTEGETANVIQNYLPVNCDRSELEVEKKAVLNTFELLKATYNDEILDNDSPQQLITFDNEKLRLFHSILFREISPKASSFRKSGASTYLADGSEFKYPHHEIISTALNTLGYVFYKLIVSFVGGIGEPIHSVGFCFAVAAFVQFHFVSIHPFEDGNGRICRFLSKRILDWVLPFPFPMFQNRQEYLDALINGRKLEDIALSPEPLMDLLLDSALKYYQTLVPNVQEIVIVAETQKQLEIKMKKYSIVGKDKDTLLKKYSELQEGDDITLELSQKPIYLKKFNPFKFIDDI